MSAKTVTNGAIFTTEQDGEIGTIWVGEGGCVFFSETYDCGFGNADVSTTPEQAALLARAVLEAQGWTFSDTGRAAMLDAPSVELVSVLAARSTLEANGWRFGPTEENPTCAVRVETAAASIEARRNMMGFALGVLAEAIADPEMVDTLPMVRDLLRQAVEACPAVN